MSLLNQRLIVLTETSDEDTSNPQEIQVPENEGKPVVDPVDSKADDTTNVVTYKDEKPDDQKIDLSLKGMDKLEDEMELQSMFGMDETVELICDVDKCIYESINTLKASTLAVKASQYKILTETVTGTEKNEKLIALLESAGESLWTKFINLLKAFIDKIKVASREIVLKTCAKFDVYGKWATKYEDVLNEIAKKSKKSDITVVTEISDWDQSKLFSFDEFAKLHQIASTILGNATKTSDMKDKLSEYDSRNWDRQDIYNYVLSKCTGIHVKGNKTKALDKVVDSIRGDVKEINLTRSKVNEMIKGLKNIKSQVLSVSSNSRLAMVNPEFDAMLTDAKRERDKYSDDTDSARYRYYRERYTVLSTAQEAAFDIYYIKIKMLSEYTHDIKNSLKGYLRGYTHDLNESVDYMSMSNEIHENAIVL